uniref:RNA-directed DNA polymerase, eukaryota n=1 Tax=Tanacetum cinerariifolium TaxID=118510 RepID=A0A699H0T1_TANCI|nr:hypothetical protein [Tanacetum cinerariifolium]
MFREQYPHNKVQQMRGARGRAYAIDGGIWYSVVSSRMDQLHLFKRDLKIQVRRWKQYATMMRQNKNLMDINIDALYNILKQNQGDVIDAMGLKKKTIMVTYEPLALIAEKIKVSKRKEKVFVSSDSEGSDADDFS